MLVILIVLIAMIVFVFALHFNAKSRKIVQKTEDDKRKLAESWSSLERTKNDESEMGIREKIHDIEMSLEKREKKLTR